MGLYREYVDRLGSDHEWREAYGVLDAAGYAAVDDVIEGLSSADWRVRRWCAAFLDHWGDDRAIPALLACVRDQRAGVRRLALHAVACQPCKETPLPIDIVGILIEAALYDPSIRVRRVALHQLGCQEHDTRAVQALECLRRDEDEKLRRIAEWALVRQGGTRSWREESVRTCPPSPTASLSSDLRKRQQRVQQ